MGGHLSKKPTKTSSSIIRYNNTQHTTEQAHTNHVINTLAVGVEVQLHIFDLVKEITECPLEKYQQYVRGILERKKDIWKDREFFNLVKEYFQNSLQTLNFCPALKECLKHAHDRASQLLTLPALQQFEEESEVGDSKYVITEEFYKIFQSVRGKHILMYVDLEQRNNKLEKKIKDIHFWKKASIVIFVAIFAVVSICIAVTAAMGYKKVATTLSPAAGCTPFVWKWIDSRFKNSERALNGHKEVIGLMQVGTHVAVKYLEDIQELIYMLTDIIAGMQKVDFASKEEAVKIKEIKKQQEVFIKNVGDLREQADIYYRNIRGAGVAVLQRFIKPPKN